MASSHRISMRSFAAALVAAGVMSGCAQIPIVTAEKPPAATAASTSPAPPEEPELPPEVSEAEAAFHDLLERAAWTKNRDWSPDSRRLEAWTPGDGPCRPLRWTFSGLESLDAVLAEESAASRSSPRSSESVVLMLRKTMGVDTPAGRNAAIAFVHWSPGQAAAAVETLERIVLRPPKGKAAARADMHEPSAAHPHATRNWREWVPLPLRCAAAEAWCLALASQPGTPESRLAPAGRALKDSSLPVEVRAELVRTLSVWIPPALLPGVDAAFEPTVGEEENVVRTPAEMRRAVADACLIHAWRLRRFDLENANRGDAIPSDLGEANGVKSPNSSAVWNRDLWPDSIHRARLDSDVAVRRSYGRWLAVAAAPEAFARLKMQLSDIEPRVREDALVSLGVLGGESALAELQKHSKAPEDRVREFAARGLCRLGPKAAAPLARDSAASVRLAVAEELEPTPGPEAAAILKPLISDADSQVQAQAARSVRRWPDRLAVPLLLQGMKSGARKTRDVCWQDLRRRAKAPDDFPIDASETERSAFQEQFIEDHRLAVTLPSAALPQSERRRPSPTVAAEDVGIVLERLRTAAPASSEYERAVELSERWTARDLPEIEAALARNPEPWPAFVLQELLPRLDPNYGALGRLSDSDVFVRRKAAQSLQRAAVDASLPGALVGRLWEPLSREQDQLVWRMVMAAVAEDALPEAARLAELAVHQTWPDIRILGCGYAERHGDPRHASWLLPLLSDSHKAVQLAAVRAIGVCRNPLALDGLTTRGDNPALPGLRSLLTSQDARLKFAVAAAMSQLGDEQGMAELARLGLHHSSETREQAATAMGRSEQTRFVEALIQQSWTENSPAVRRAQLAALERLVPEENRPAQLGGMTSEDGKIKAWSAWWEKNHPAAPR